MLARVIEILFDLYLLGLIAYAVASWAQHSTAYRVRAFLAPYYEPFLKPMQQLLRSLNLGGAQVDFSPFVFALLIIVVRNLVVGILAGLI
jgi:uncharacterized protein YggT (Ycf19 family)